MTGTSVDVEGLYQALDTRRQSKKLSWRALAQELGIAPSTFTRMVQGRRPDADTFAAMVQWLEVPMDHFVRGGREPERIEVIGTYLRMDKNITPEAASALETVIRTMYEQMREQH